MYDVVFFNSDTYYFALLSAQANVGSHSSIDLSAFSAESNISANINTLNCSVLSPLSNSQAYNFTLLATQAHIGAEICINLTLLSSESNISAKINTLKLRH